MHLKLIGCEIFYREICAVAARACNQVDVEFLPKGLHDIGCTGMRERIQQAVDNVDGSRYESVVLGYGLCGNGLVGLRARSLPLVLPRAHDCITLFMGSAPRYMDYFQNHSGVYFRTTGWLERAESLDQLDCPTIQMRNGLGADKAALAARYGEENAEFLQEELGRYLRQYGQLTFIEMGVEPDDRFEKQARAEAEKRGWKYEKLQGSLSLLKKLVDGEWDEKEFLVVPPGWKVVAKYDDRIIEAEQPSA